MRKEAVLILLVLLFAPFIFANGAEKVEARAEENRERPVIPLSFHARVRATLYNTSQHSDVKQTYFSGGGLFAFDQVKGFQRVELFMKAQGGNTSAKPHYIHSLDRYDLQYKFNINYDRTCRKSDTVGKLQHPFDWVQFSSFAGESTYNGQKLENWEYMVKGKLYRVAVKKGTNIPVVFEMGDDFVKGKEMKLELIVSEWNKKVRPHMLSFIPINCGGHSDAHLLGDVNGVVDFADNNWQCADVACDQTVPAGSGQPGYACAEFTARSLAAGGYLPGLGPLDDQGDYSNYGYNGNTYNLCYTTTLSSALGALGFTSESATPGAVNAGCAAFGDGGDGDWSHAVIGVGPGIDDAHNNARYHWPVSGSLYGGVDAVQCPPGQTPGSSSSGSSGSSSGGTYYSYQNEVKVEENGGNGGVIYENKESNKVMDKTEYLVDAEPSAIVDDVRVFEEKTNKKFE